ncbi:MAG: NAD(P)H-hydrate dehydratase [Clostridia bacterium]|nr:NAD(P)H-hydrate dehydratase [Clostridia bacterium]
MKDIVTIEQMQSLEREAIERGTSALELMYRAGAQMAKYLMSATKGRVLVMCGRGNNGGDGFTAAWLLSAEGREVLVYCPYSASELTEQSRFYFEKCTGVTSDLEQCARFKPEVILDALYGVGFHGSLSGDMLKAVRFINASGCQVVSADVPSGMWEDSVCANVTLCVHAPKMHTCCGKSAIKSGTLKVLDIGIKSYENGVKLLEQDDIIRLLPSRSRYGHKNTFGSVGIVGGCVGMEGAAMLSAMAAAKCGAGKVSVISSLDYYLNRPPHIMQRGTLDRQSCLAFGMGAGRSDDAADMLTRVLCEDCHAVIDADGLYAASRSQAVPQINAQRRKKGYKTVFTPHVGEAAMLLGIAPEQVERDPISAARSISEKYNCITVLKSWYSVICDGEIYVLNSPESALAKAGSGDCLAGMCAAFVAQGASVAGAVMLHNASGRRAAEQYGRASATALDIISCINF